MKFQDDISNMNTYIRTDKPKPICPPHFFKVGGITRTAFSVSLKTNYLLLTHTIAIKLKENRMQF